MILPPVPKALLEYLDLTFPLRSPRLAQSDREIWVEVGNLEVVDVLRQIWRAQEEVRDEPSEGGLPNVLLVPKSLSGDDPPGADAGSSGSSAARTPGSAGNRLGS